MREATDRSPRPALWPAYLATYLFMVGQWASGVAVPLHVGLLGGSFAVAGSIAAVRFGLGALFQLPFGAVADAWGTRRTLFVAIAGNALVNLVPLMAAATRGIWILYLWAVLSGLTSSLFLPAMSAFVAGNAPDRSRGSAFGWLTLGTHAGVASGPAIGGVVWEHFGVAPTYLVSASIGVIALVGPLLIAGAERARLRFAGLPGMVAAVARDRAIVGVWLAALAIGLPWGAVSGLFPLFGTSLGLTAGSIGLLLALQSAANGASRVPLGRLIDRRAVPPLTAAGTAFGYALITSLLGLQSSPLGIGLIFVTGIVALAFTLMLVQVVISERAPPALRATGLGGYGATLSAGLGFGPFLAGPVADARGFAAAFGLVAGIGALIAVVAAAVLWGTRRADRAMMQP
jgi:MFS family permease